jgi:hypothetical protein
MRRVNCGPPRSGGIEYDVLRGILSGRRGPIRPEGRRERLQGERAVCRCSLDRRNVRLASCADCPVQTPYQRVIAERGEVPIDCANVISHAADESDLYRLMSIGEVQFTFGAAAALRSTAHGASPAAIVEAILRGDVVLLEGPPPLARSGAVIVPEPEPEPVPAAPARPQSWIEIQLLDEDDQPVPNEEYRIYLTDGSTRTGALDAQGLARVDDIDPGMCEVMFPNRHGREWSRA